MSVMELESAPEPEGLDGKVTSQGLGDVTLSGKGISQEDFGTGMSQATMPTPTNTHLPSIECLSKNVWCAAVDFITEIGDPSSCDETWACHKIVHHPLRPGVFFSLHGLQSLIMEGQVEDGAFATTRTTCLQDLVVYPDPSSTCAALMKEDDQAVLLVAGGRFDLHVLKLTNDGYDWDEIILNWNDSFDSDLVVSRNGMAAVKRGGPQCLDIFKKPILQKIRDKKPDISVKMPQGCHPSFAIDAGPEGVLVVVRSCGGLCVLSDKSELTRLESSGTQSTRPPAIGQSRGHTVVACDDTVWVHTKDSEKEWHRQSVQACKSLWCVTSEGHLVSVSLGVNSPPKKSLIIRRYHFPTVSLAHPDEFELTDLPTARHGSIVPTTISLEQGTLLIGLESGHILSTCILSAESTSTCYQDDVSKWAHGHPKARRRSAGRDLAGSIGD